MISFLIFSGLLSRLNPRCFILFKNNAVPVYVKTTGALNELFKTFPLVIVLRNIILINAIFAHRLLGEL